VGTGIGGAPSVVSGPGIGEDANVGALFCGKLPAGPWTVNMIVDNPAFTRELPGLRSAPRRVGPFGYRIVDNPKGP